MRELNMEELNSALVQKTGNESYAQASEEIKRSDGGEPMDRKDIGLVKNSHGSKRKWVGDELR